MRIWRLAQALAILGTAALCSEPKAKPDSKVKPEPGISSIYPAGGQRGTTFQAVLRGSGLAGARLVMFEGQGIEARVLGLDPEGLPAEEAGKEAPKHASKEVLRLQVTIAAEANPGAHDFRIVTERGVSNKIPLAVVAEPVLQETTSAAAPLRRFPMVINGRIALPGESDSYWIEAAAGETLTFAVTSFNEKFDPSVEIAEKSGSWFDPERLNVIASNDEPLSFPGLSTDARLVERFPHAGNYCLRVRGFSGEGGAGLCVCVTDSARSSARAAAASEAVGLLGGAAIYA